MPEVGVRQPKKPRPELLGVNLFDMEKCGPALIGRVLGGKLEDRPLVYDPDKEDEVLVVLSCGLETGVLALDVLRSEGKRIGVNSIRVYLSKSGDRTQWVKIPNETSLSVEKAGRFLPNPKVFPRVESAAEVVAPPLPQRIDFGGGK